MSFGPRQTTFSIPDISSEYPMRNTLPAAPSTGAGALPQARQTVSGQIGYKSESSRPARNTISGRPARAGSQAQAELSPYTRVVVTFINENDIKIGQFDIGKYPLDKATQMYMTDFFQVFEKAVQNGIDPHFEQAPPPKKEAGQDIIEARKNYLLSYIATYTAVLTVLDYPNVGELKILQPRTQSFQTMPHKETLAAFKSLAYIINASEVCSLFHFSSLNPS